MWQCTEDTNAEDPPLTGFLVATYQMCMIFLFPAILMTSSYYKVIKTLWKSTKNMRFLTNTANMRAIDNEVSAVSIQVPTETEALARERSTQRGRSTTRQGSNNSKQSTKSNTSTSSGGRNYSHNTSS